MRMLLFFFILILMPAVTFADNQTSSANTETAILAGGCFWCTEADFEKVEGVIKAESGYTGGHTVNPTYKQVSSGTTGHLESVRITFDPEKISYASLIDHYWRTVDPTRNDGQFCDAGPQYRPAIFYLNDEQKKQALASQKRLERTKPFKAPLKVELIKAGEFYPAEEYHQDYYKKNPIRYNYYRFGCRRDARLEELWGKKH